MLVVKTGTTTLLTIVVKPDVKHQVIRLRRIESMALCRQLNRVVPTFKKETALLIYEKVILEIFVLNSQKGYKNKNHEVDIQIYFYRKPEYL